MSEDQEPTDLAESVASDQDYGMEDILVMMFRALGITVVIMFGLFGCFFVTCAIG